MPILCGLAAILGVAVPGFADELPTKETLRDTYKLCAEAMDTRNLDALATWSKYSDFRWTGNGLIVGIGGNPKPGSATDWCIISPAATEGRDEIPFVESLQEALSDGDLRDATSTVSLFKEETRAGFERYDVVGLICLDRFAFLVSADSGAITINTLPFRPGDCGEDN